MTNIKGEAQIHFELYRHMQNALDKKVNQDQFQKIKFQKVETEYSKGIVGNADLVVFDKKDRPWLVIEMKRLNKDKVIRNIDPFSPKVIKQAYEYANQLGAPYFATSNGDNCIVFQTIQKFISIIDRQAKAYKITNLEEFALELLIQIDQLEANRTEWDSNEKLIVIRLKSIHDQLIDKIVEGIVNSLKKDKKFKFDFVNWMKSQGWDPKEAKGGVIILAEQASYMMINILFFLRILQNHPKYQIKAPRIDPTNLFNSIQVAFKAIIKKIDFQAIFELDSIFDKINYALCEEIILDYIEDLSSWNLQKIRDDILGQIYQNVIPPTLKHDLGQYYTPPDIVNAICEFCIQNYNDIILDPACGSGGFLIGAYEILGDFYSKTKFKEDEIHKKIISQLYGVDINRFPAHLCAINLALRNLNVKTEKVNLFVYDFFDLIKKQYSFYSERISISGSEEQNNQILMPISYDAIVANPPYIRQELIVDKEKVRRHLSNEEKKLISERSDIYVYFLIKAAKYLKLPTDTTPGGRIGFLTSERWLYTGYGEGFQKFLLRNFTINSIIVFEQQAFETALIETSILLITRETIESKRNKNFVRFIRIKEKMEINEIMKLLKKEIKKEIVEDKKNYFFLTKNQENLKDTSKWRKFIYAPDIYWDILNTVPMVKLGDIATIKFGIKTGHNDFFYLKEKDLDALEIPDGYYRKLVKSVGQLDYINFKANDTEWYVLDLEPFVEETLRNIKKSDELQKTGILTKSVKDLLENKQMDKLLAYIKKGEKAGIHNIKSIEGRRVWFSLGDLMTPPLIFTKEMWKKNIIYLNSDDLAIDQHLYTIYPNEDIDHLVLLGILNSALCAISRDLEGRIAAGQALSRIENTVEDAKNLKIIDPQQLNDTTKKEIRDAVLDLIKTERNLIDNKSEGTFFDLNEEYVEKRRKLNLAVLKSINMEDRIDELEDSWKNLIKLRIKMGGQKKDVLLKKKGEKLKLKLSGEFEIKTASKIKKRSKVSLEKYLS